MEIKQAKTTNQLKKVKRPNQGWHRADIKCQLEKRGYTLRKVGEDADYCARAAQKVFGTWWPRMERVVADALEVEPWEIWPERYNDYGQPVQPGNPNKVKTTRLEKRCNVNVQRVD